MSTDAKRAGNAKYLAQFKTVTLRFLPDDMEAVKAAAAGAGESVAGYIQRAIQDRMTGRILPDDVRKAAKDAAEAVGETVPAFIARAIDDTAKRDELTRILKR